MQCPVSSAVQVLVLGISGTRSVQGLLLSQLTDCSSEEVQITLWNRLSCRKCFTSELWWFWFFVCLGGFCVGFFFFVCCLFFVYCFCAGVTLDQYTPKTWAKSHQYPEAFIWPKTSWNLSIFAGIIWQFLKNSLLISKFREVKRCACFLSAGLVYQVGFFSFFIFFSIPLRDLGETVLHVCFV